MASSWPTLSLADARVSLIDCDHRTPPANGSGLPYVAIPQIKHGRLDLSDVRRISHDHFLQWTRKAKPQAFDVILSRRCNPGETAFVPPGLECALGQNLVLLRADGTKVFPPFLRWLVRSPEWWDQIGKFLNVGAVFDSLKCADIPNFRLSLPSLPEQRRIAEILGTLDDKIEFNRRMNETLEDVCRAIFRSWFVNFDPVHAKAAARRGFAKLDPQIAALFPSTFQGSDLGEIPESWSIGKLEDVADVVMGTSPPGATYNDVGIGTPLVNGPVEFGDYFTAKKKWTTAPLRMAEPGDLVFCVRGSTTGRHVVADDNYCLGRGVCAIRSRHGANGFVYGLIDANLNRLLSNVSGSVFPNLNGPDFKQFKIIRPPAELIVAYQRTIEPTLRKIWLNVEESNNLARTRDALLPKLLSGDISVREQEPKVSSVL